MHFGMTGWMHIRGMRTGYTNYYNKLKADEIDAWPPKFWKLQFETDSSPKLEVAFTDPRRFGRVRLVDCPGAAIREHSPLVENGPDPVVDANTTFTEEYFLTTMHKRHMPIKALLLDQAFISGIGNWVGDEVLFHARLHPEQYCDEFSESQMKKLYRSIRYVCQTAVDLIGDSDRFPDDWLFRHRWGKGSKNLVAQLPNGEKLAFLTVGGRTSCFAPALQKKTGKVAPGITEEPVVIKEEKARNGTTMPALKKDSAKAPATTESVAVPQKKQDGAKRKRTAVEKEVDDSDENEDEERKKGKVAPVAASSKSTPVKRSSKSTPKTSSTKAKTPAANTGRRRSARLGLP